MKFKRVNSKNWKSKNDVLAIAVSKECPNCKLALQVIDDCKIEDVEINLINFDTEVDLCDNIFEIFEVPTYLYLKNGEVKGRLWGLQEPLSVKGFSMIHKETWKNETTN